MFFKSPVIHEADLCWHGVLRYPTPPVAGSYKLGLNDPRQVYRRVENRLASSRRETRAELCAGHDLPFFFFFTEALPGRYSLVASTKAFTSFTTVVSSIQAG